MKRKALLSVLVAGLSVPIHSHLTSFAQIPPQDNPGLVTQIPQRQAIVPPAPIKAEIKVEAAADKLTAPLAATPWPVQTLVLEGNTLLKEKDLQKIFQSYQGQTLTSLQMETLLKQINELYAMRGYQTSFASVPDNAYQAGTLTLQAHEGKVGNISITGNRFYKAWLIERSLDAKSEKPLNVKALQASANISNQFNNFQVKTVTLVPNEETGKTDIQLSVSDREPWQISPTFDNQGRPYIGTYREGVELSDQNLLGLGDRLSSRYIHGAGTDAVQLGYNLPLDGRGDELGFIYTFNHVNVDLNRLHQPDNDASTPAFGPSLTIPITKNRSLVSDFSFIMRRSGNFLNDTKTSQFNTHFFNTGLTYNKPDPWGRTTLRYQISAGQTSSNKGNVIWRHEILLNRIQKMPLHNTLLLRGDVVMATDRLPTSQTLQLGGAYSVRGYTEGLILGDRGFLVNVEDRWPIPFLHSVSPWLADRLQGAAFFDIGQAWLDHANTRFRPGVSNRTGNTLLMGTGVGLRYRLNQYLMGFADLGIGLVNRQNLELNAQPSVRVHFGVRTDLLSDALFHKADHKAKADNPQAAVHTAHLFRGHHHS